MKGLLAVTRRELLERRMVFLAGAILGLLPLMAPLLPGAAGHSSDVRQILLITLLCAFAWGSALVLGGSVYVRDLSERRLGFYLSRPLSPAAVFGGKMLGALLIVLGASVLLVIPSALFGALRGKWLGGGGVDVIVGLLVVGAIVLLPLAHAVATAIRADDPWKALHVPAFALMVLLVAWAGAEMGHATLSMSAILYALAFSLLIPFVLAIAGFLQAAVGRTDAVRSHRALGVAVWGMLLSLALFGAGGAAWWSRPAPSTLRKFDFAVGSPGAGWAFVGGEGSGLRSHVEWGFLVDTHDPTRFVRTGPTEGFGSSVGFSADGRVAAWFTPSREGMDALRVEPREWELKVAKSDGNRITVARAGLTTAWNSPFGFELSPSGSRVALLGKELVSVVDLASGKTLVAAKPATRHTGNLNLAFTDEDHVRFVESWWFGGAKAARVSPASISLFELDIPARRLVRTGELSFGPTKWARYTLNATGDRMIAMAEGQPATFREGRSGRLLATLGEHELWGAFLADGRMALVGHRANWSLDVFSAEGAPERIVDLGPLKYAVLGGQPDARSVLVGAQKADLHSSFVVDLATGSVKEMRGLFPSVAAWWASPGRSRAPQKEMLFVDDNRKLELVDMTTGSRSTVLPR